jgi:hypothetical protein
MEPQERQASTATLRTLQEFVESIRWVYPDDKGYFVDAEGRVVSVRARPPLTPLHEYNASRGGLREAVYPRYNGISCPSCGGEMVDAEPPREPAQIPVGCPRCGCASFRVL